MIRRIGCRAHDYGQDTIEVLTGKMGMDGYTTTQLALKKALSTPIDLSDATNLDQIKHIQTVMVQGKMDIGVLGAYLNYAHPDYQIRESNLKVLGDHLRIANDIGARMVGTETGSLDPNYKAHKDNHDEEAYSRFKEAIEGVMPIARLSNTYMAVEAVAHHIIHSPASMIRLIKEIEDDRLKVIFDINNMITIENQGEQEAMIHEMFDTLEEQIWAVHVKDFDFVDGEKVIVPLGEGRLKLDVLMERVKQSPQEVDVLAENIRPDRLADTFVCLSAYKQ